MAKDTSRMILFGLIGASIILFGVSGYMLYDVSANPRCEACGMSVTPEIRQHISIKDERGTTHYACCQGCMLRLLDPIRGYEELNIETYCDYYGPNYKITIKADKYGNETTVNPTTARILLGTKVITSCANNRIAYNQTAAEALIRDGYSQYTMSWQKNLLPNGTPVMTVNSVALAMAQKGMSYTPPSPLLPVLLVGIGGAVLAVSWVAYKKLIPR